MYTTADRREQRSRARLIRDAIPAKERGQRSEEICLRAQHLLGTTSAQIIMIYMSFRTEVETTPLIDALCSSYCLTAPRIDTDRQEIQAHLLTREALVRSEFGILEPAPTATTIDPKAIDAVLVPGLTFDSNGYRLGYGSGYYDAFLPRCQKALRLGLCFELQLVDSVYPRIWDEPLHHVITEQRVIDTRYGISDG